MSQNLSANNMTAASGMDTAIHTCMPYPYPSSFFIYGVLLPTIAIFTLITNSLIITIFMRRSMRTPTSVLLIGLAIGDILAGNVILPSYIYVYGLHNSDQYLPFPMCIFYDYGAIFGAIFHQTSTWITMVLGIQRFIVVAFPLQGRRFFTIRKSVVCIVLVNFISLIMYSPSFFSTKYSKVTVNGTVLCICDDNSDISDGAEGTMSILRCVFGQLVPCTVLTITTILLIRRLGAEKKQMMKIRADENRARERRDFRHIRRTSLMVILIVTTFLMVEFPNGIYFAFMFVDSLTMEENLKVATIMNTLVYVVNHINFWIYVTLSSHFRKTLKRLIRSFFCKSKDSNGKNGSFESTRCRNFDL
ncbi:hypothetical protein FSP39_010296 [Pinctada imbricata]|uniref:G-protein coupled receptors family 1 profile domain-containing protein n=1 Tax=Pinctada imbricata TaxID=66713 RepID=A0AA89BSM0_PINIB|nr:hypothetical protein FSP39_010296 [Pinctada imbricata]